MSNQNAKMVAVTISINGCSKSIFTKVPCTPDGKVVLTPESFNRLCEEAFGTKLQRGTTVSYG